MSKNEIEVDVLIDPEEEVEQFKAVPVSLSREGEQQWLSDQEHYRAMDHNRWNLRGDKQFQLQEEHVQKTNRFNLINSVVHMAALAAIVALLVKAVG